jgi:phosphomannomutase
LRDYEGDLLILYGDTPLFRPASIRGLLNRHRLKGAHLTLLTAVAQRVLPYGRIIRDAGGHIIDIIEDVEASPNVREIRELNAGAYLVRAPAIFTVLSELAKSGDRVRLTDCVHRMLRSGMRVESYCIYDEDEVLGINTKEDLAQAEFILRKRLHRPRRQEERNVVKFGTGGWRAVIGEGFTLHNVRRLCQALSNEVTRRGDEDKGVLVGYDRRFLSDRAAEAAAEVFTGNNIAVTILREAAPTPLITYATALNDVAYGLAFTASHNPPEWNGLKVFRNDGSLLLDAETRSIETEVNALTTEDVVKIDLDLALEAGIAVYKDFTNEYVDAVETLIDLEAIREADLRVIVDPMYGVGQLTMGIILTEARCRVTFINERHNPLFGGRSPAPNLDALRLLMTHIRNGGYDLGLATDGDADRIAIVDETGRYITVNDILLLLYWYMHEVRGESGGVVRNLATTHLLDRLATHFGEKSIEVPVGFKHISSAMVTHNALLGGESSGGLTIQGHILGKDGIFAAALVVEMLARTGMKVSELMERVYAITGRLYAVETNVLATSEMRVSIPQLLRDMIEACGDAAPYIGSQKVQRISDMDGTKFYLENDNWVLIRFSGTEPVLRLFAEAVSEEEATMLIDAVKLLVNLD